MGKLLVMALIRSCGVEGCQRTCRTGCSWTRTDASLGVTSKAQIQTTFDRMVSTVARRVPSGLKVIMATPRGGPDDSGLMLNAEELVVSAYSASPIALVDRSRQMVREPWSVGKTWESVVDDENFFVS